MRLGGEIVSVDSRQLYRGLRVTSNAPTDEDLRGIPAHLVGIVDPGTRINVASFVAMARPVLDEIRGRGLTPVITAGTGLYLKALVDGLELGEPPPPAPVRAALEAEALADLPALVGRLRDLDPAAADVVDVDNPARVVRRMEMALARGAHGPGAPAASLVATIKVGLAVDRQVLYRRIEARADEMLSGGWRDEVEALIAAGIDPGAQAFTSIGLAELAAVARGDMALADARAVIVQRTRNYAKRQMTWFRADPGVRWIDVTALPLSDIVDRVVASVSS
ncbi:MAG: tRNA dimethylallyltransferase [Chloroflexota bacterium]|nr:tRNA dimethylallyltransferase [Chloroflexota bacterium]